MAETTVVDVVAPTQLLVPQVREVAQQPPPSDAGQETKPDEHVLAITVDTPRVVVVVLVETLIPLN